MEECPDSEDKPQVIFFPDLEIVLEPGSATSEDKIGWHKLLILVRIVFFKIVSYIFRK